MPIDSVPLETTIQFAASSHLNNKWFKPRKFATHLNYEKCNDSDESRDYLDVPDKDDIYKTYKILKFDVEPGDCIVFHMRTLHGAPGNTSKSTARRIFSTRWLGIEIQDFQSSSIASFLFLYIFHFEGDDAVIGRRPWLTSPPTTGGLKVGQSVIHSDEFPLIWSRSK